MIPVNHHLEVFVSYRDAMSYDKANIGRSGSYMKGIARRKEILDRAIEVFAERGADGTSLRKIGEAIGVSHAALLHYFDSREQLLIAVYEHAENRRHRAEAGLVRSAVEVLADAALDNVREPGMVQLYTTLVAAAVEAGNEISREHFSKRFAALRESLAESFRSDQQAGTIRADVDPHEIAALLIAASDGLQIQWLLEPSVGLQSTLRVFSRLLSPVAPKPAP